MLALLLVVAALVGLWAWENGRRMTLPLPEGFAPRWREHDRFHRT